MSDLIEQLEGLKGPCRECDALIELEVGDNGPAIQKLIDESPHNTIDEIAKAADREASSLWFRIPAYTSSLDAAMTLVPEGAKLTFQNHGDMAGRSMWLVEPIERFASGATPAIALCIAALKATP